VSREKLLTATTREEFRESLRSLADRISVDLCRRCDCRNQTFVDKVMNTSRTKLLAKFYVSITIFSWLILPPAYVWADDILLSAAASLTDVLKEISGDYQSKSRHTIKFNFGPSSALARQIEEGAPADLFFSADLPQMDTLDKNGRLEPGTRKNLLSNQLVIIVPADSKLTLSSPRDLLNADVKRIALAEPSSVPVGVYSSNYLADEGLWDKVKSKIVPVQDVRATLASVASGNVEAGFVYKTDAAVSKKIRIVYEVPINKGPKITYPIAILKESKRKDAARDFMNYVTTSFAKASFQTYGFVILD
jgi:molybdate transport system substrate-binding protein